MASPPFGLQTSSPADTDFVSQFPANERTNRDVIQSWLEVDHNTNGNHTVVHLPYQSSVPTTPPSSVAAMYVDVNGNLVILKPDGNVYYAGVTPGTISYTAGSTADNGYTLADGSAISRTGIGAALFARISTTYGVGDGSTTFNVPHVAGRVIAGKEATATLLTTANSGIDGGTLGATGGRPNFTLLQTDLPNVTLSLTGTASGNVDFSYSLITGNNNTGNPVVNALQGDNTGAQKVVVPTSLSVSGTTVSLNGNVTQTFQFTSMQSIVLLAQIKL